MFVVAVAFGEVFQVGEIGAVLRVFAVGGRLKMGEGGLVTPQRGIHAGKGAVFFGAVGLGGDDGFELEHAQQAAVAVQRVGGFREGGELVGGDGHVGLLRIVVSMGSAVFQTAYFTFAHQVCNAQAAGV